MTKKTEEGRVNKSYWIPRELSREFKATCAMLDVRNSEIVEMLMYKWVRDVKRRKKKVS